MKFHNVDVEVSGILNIVINRKDKYERVYDMSGNSLWVGNGRLTLDAHMCNKIRRLLRETVSVQTVTVEYEGERGKKEFKDTWSRPKYRLWISGDTLNIVRIEY